MYKLLLLLQVLQTFTDKDTNLRVSTIIKVDCTCIDSKMQILAFWKQKSKLIIKSELVVFSAMVIPHNNILKSSAQTTHIFQINQTTLEDAIHW